MELHQIIRRPLVTEKTTLMREGNQYLFEVDPRANKIEIEKAVEKLYMVMVVDVRTLNVLGKKKRVGRLQGKKSDWKKAIVTVAPGSTIEIFDKA
jgi:large subunit ribosomal protein L23